jgi:DNA-binding transcriptional ArsR family regulator
MREGPSLATIASLLGEPARTAMLTALMHGRAMTAGELAREAGVTPQTASAHLARLRESGLVLVAHQGRHRYHRLAGPEVAEVLEGLMDLAARTAGPKARFGPKDASLREARLCYDHLAGAAGVALYDGLVASGRLDAATGLALTPAGRHFVAELGIDLAVLEAKRRPLCRACLDWSERRTHLAGSLGAALFHRFGELGWLRPRAGSRIVEVTPPGRAGLARLSRPAVEVARARALP